MLTGTHLLINASDLTIVKSLINCNRPYKVVDNELADEVFHPKPQRKVVYKVPQGKVLIIFVNPFMMEGDEPKDCKDLNRWYKSKFENHGVKSELVSVKYIS